MKKLFTFFAVAFTFGVSAQSVVMTEVSFPALVNQGTVSSGDTIQVNTSTDHYNVPVRLTFSGVSSGDVSIRIQAIEETNCFMDQICGYLYPDLDFQSSCWTPNTANYITPTMSNIQFAAGDTVVIEPKGAMTCGGCTQHRYFISLNNVEIDSFDIRVCTTLSTPTVEKEELSVSVYPNPAANYLNVATTGMDGNVILRMTDMLGKVVYNETMSSAKKLDVADFKNGVYVLSIMENGKAVQTKRVVIKH